MVQVHHFKLLVSTTTSITLTTRSLLLSSTIRNLATCVCSELKCKHNVLQSYESMVRCNQVHYDLHQVRALKELDRLRQDLLEQVCVTSVATDSGTSTGSSESEFSWSTLFSSFTSTTGVQKPKVNMIKGVYLHGGVGRGKTFCMDLFYTSLYCSACDDNTKKVRKQRVHFHKFMLQQVHRQMHHIKQKSPKLNADEVLQRVIHGILQRGFVLCFDEFQVTDVADALILRRLFTGLMSQGAKVVITSNRPPEDLYKGGIQRDLFMPFIDFIHHNMAVVSMDDSETDYRILIAKQHKARGVYFVGNEKPLFDAAVTDLIANNNNNVDTSLSIMTPDGRKVRIPMASSRDAVAKFSFDDLCKTAMGAADYLAIGEKFHTVFVEGIPKMSIINEVNVVRRFILFVDSMYECNVKLIIYAEANPSELFSVDESYLNASDESFAVDRTRSRLEEMKSESYLRKRWVGEQGSQPFSTEVPDRLYLSQDIE